MAYHLLGDYENALQVLEDFRKTLTVCSQHTSYPQEKIENFFQSRNQIMIMNKVSCYYTCIR